MSSLPRFASLRTGSCLLAAAFVLGLAGCAAVLTRPRQQAPLVPLADPPATASTSANGMAPPMVRVVDPKPILKNGVAQQLQDGVPQQRLQTVGIPYFLPMGVFEISLTSIKDDKGQHKDMALKSTPRFVPDPTAGYVIDSSKNAFFTQNHTFKVKDGLLTSVSTHDEGKVGEVLSTLLSTVLNGSAYNVAKAGFQGLREPAADPSPEELMELYSAISAGEHTFVFTEKDYITGANTAEIFELPGTDGVLKIQLTCEDQLGAALPSVPKDPASYSASDRDAVAVQGEFQGLYARVLKPVRYEVKIVVDKKALYTKRAKVLGEKFDANIDALAKIPAQLTALDAQIAAQDALDKQFRDEATKLASAVTPAALVVINNLIDLAKTARAASDALSAQKAALAKTKKALEDENAKIGANDTVAGSWREKNKSLLNNIAARAPNATALVRGASALVPDKRLVAQIPLRRQPLGTSKNLVTLESGVVTELHTEQPALALEAVKLVYNLVGAVIDLPARIIQLRIDYTNKQRDLATAEKDRDTTQQAIDKLHAKPTPAPAPTAHDLEVKALEQQKAIVALQKEIAEMEAAIIRATTQPLVPPRLPRKDPTP